MMQTLNEETMEGLVNSCIEQAEQEAAAEPMGHNLSHPSLPPTTDESEDLEHAAHVGCWIGECGHYSTISEDRLPLMDYTADAEHAATPKRQVSDSMISSPPQKDDASRRNNLRLQFT